MSSRERRRLRASGGILPITAAVRFGELSAAKRSSMTGKTSAQLSAQTLGRLSFDC